MAYEAQGHRFARGATARCTTGMSTPRKEFGISSLVGVIDVFRIWFVGGRARSLSEKVDERVHQYA